VVLKMIGNAVAGYRLAWAHWWRLLAVLLPVLAPASAGLFLLDLLLDRDSMVIIDGLPVFHGGGGTWVWVRPALVAACWLLALCAAAVTATAAARGYTVRPLTVILAAFRRLPVYASGMAAAVTVTLLALWVAAGLAGAAGAAAGLVAVLGTLVVAGVVSARMLVGVISHQLGGFDWSLTRGRVRSTAGAFLLGGVAVPLALTYPGRGLGPALALPVTGQAIEVLLATGLIAAQAGILAHVYLLRREEPAAAGEESADLPAVDARLAELSRGPARGPWLGLAATAIAVLVPAGFAAANPLGTTTVRSHADVPGDAVALAWPAGRHPVIATMAGARFCDDDACARYTAPNGGPAVLDRHGTAGFSPDGGVVVKAALTGGADHGGPFIHYARCTREGCPEAWLPARSSAKEPFGWPELAAGAAPDQAVWFVLAMPSREERPGKATYRVTFIRCADLGCTDPQRHDAGTVDRMPDDGALDGARIRLSVGADGRPMAAIRTGSSVALLSCAPITCAAVTKTWTFAGADPVWAAPSTSTGPASSFQPGMVRIGEQLVSLDSGRVPPGSGTLAVTGSGVYATAAEATTRRGLRVTVGAPDPQAPPEYWQQVLWRCAQLRCRRQVLDTFASAAGGELLAVGADGRVLLVRPDRILLVSAPGRG
jgi:hypothetical protein